MGQTVAKEEERHHGDYAVLRRIPGVRSREFFVFYWCCGNTKKDSPGCMITPPQLAAEVVGLGMSDWRNTVMNTINGGRGTVQGTVKAGTMNGGKRKKKAEEEETNGHADGEPTKRVAIHLPVRLALDPLTAFKDLYDASSTVGMRSRGASTVPATATIAEAAPLGPPPSSSSEALPDADPAFTLSSPPDPRDRAKTVSAGNLDKTTLRRRASTMAHQPDEDDITGFGSLENLAEQAEEYGFQDKDTDRDFLFLLDNNEQQVDITVSSCAGLVLIDPPEVTPRSAPIIESVADDSPAADQLQADDKVFMVGPIRVLGMSAAEAEAVLAEVNNETLITVARSNNLASV